MTLLPMAPPEPIPQAGGFDYVTVDAVHRRVYAAHTGAKSLLIVNADSGAVEHQIAVGPMHGVAYTADGSKVYTGNGDAMSVSESDPATFTVLRSVAVAGPVDAIAFDEGNKHIYADEDDGTQIFVIDAGTMKQIATIKLPGHKPEYLAIDPASHTVYQNIADKSEVVTIDPDKLEVATTIPTPELVSNHPLQFDAAFKQLVVGGANGVLSVYDATGKKQFETTMPAHVDQCDLDQQTHRLACAAGTGFTVFQLAADAPPKVIGTYAGSYRMHTLAFDDKTHDVWAVMVDEASGTNAGYIQRFSVKP
jgi:DNA-binding beta-propeller fold protein YncE